MTSKAFDIPNLAVAPTVTIVAEESLIRHSILANSLGQVTLTARKIAALATMSLELMEVYIVGLDDVVRARGPGEARDSVTDNC